MSDFICSWSVRYNSMMLWLLYYINTDNHVLYINLTWKLNITIYKDMLN